MGSQNLACTYCRSRKIKCDRMRPVCQNCQRDDIDCEYSNPSRRVNHMKLLYQSVESLDSRLADFEGQIHQLANLLKNGQATSSEGKSTKRIHSSATRTEKSVPLKDRFVIRNPWLGCNLYYGPASLIASCKSLSHDLLDQHQDQDTNRSYLEHLLDSLCMEVRQAPDAKGSLSLDSIRLPPRRVLDMVLTQFIAQSKLDYMLDIFSTETLIKSVGAAYSEDKSAEYIAWAVCFNVIILLCLGTEQPTGPNADPFLQPYIIAVQAAVHQLQLWMVPKLVNVQTLTLLSAAAQRYCTVDVADSLFAQACVLAKTMGLHQVDISSEHLTPAECKERQKVFRSLYIRDKAMAVSRGSPCWLSGAECSILVSPDMAASEDYQHVSMRTELADIQFDCYRWLHSDRSPEKKKEQQESFANLKTRLDHFSSEHKLPASSYPESLDDLDLHLSFFSTRIYLLSACLEPTAEDEEQLVNDARLSCLLMLCLQQQSGRSSFRKMYNKAVNGKHSDNIEVSTSNDDTTKEQPSHSLHRLALAFPATSLVRLARSVIFAETNKDKSSNAEDMLVLNALRSSLRNIETPPSRINTLTFVLGQTLHKLLRVVEFYLPQVGGSDTSGCSSGASTISSTHDSLESDATRRPPTSYCSSPAVAGQFDAEPTLPRPPTSDFTNFPVLNDMSLNADMLDDQWSHFNTIDPRLDLSAVDGSMDIDGQPNATDQWDSGLWSMVMQQFPE